MNVQSKFVRRFNHTATAQVKSPQAVSARPAQRQPQPWPDKLRGDDGHVCPPVSLYFHPGRWPAALSATPRDPATEVRIQTRDRLWQYCISLIR